MQFRITGLLLLGAMALLRDRTNHPCSAGNYTNSGRRNQTADRHGRTAPFQSRECHSSAGREEQCARSMLLRLLAIAASVLLEKLELKSNIVGRSPCAAVSQAYVKSG
jgi:hypothetical protein